MDLVSWEEVTKVNIDSTELFGNSQMSIIGWMVVINLLLGTVYALRKGDFNFSLLSDYLRDYVIPYVFGFAVIELLGTALPNLNWFVFVSFILVVLSLGSAILSNLHKFGVTMPKVVRKVSSA